MSEDRVPGALQGARQLGKAEKPTRISYGTRVVLTCAFFVLSVFAVVYWAYPFDGMMVEESWSLYAPSPGTPEPTLSSLTQQLPAWLRMRRGISHLLLRLMWLLHVSPVTVNLLLVGLQLVNVVLFGLIVWQLGGRSRVFPVLFAAVFYPFASAAHFWQIMVVHHVAVLGFLVSPNLCFITVSK